VRTLPTTTLRTRRTAVRFVLKSPRTAAAPRVVR
jgi:hypothetical protein